MGKLVVSEYITLDGVSESPEQWQFPFLTPDLAEYIQGQVLGYDSLLLGRRTYDVFAAAWPARTHNEFGVADKFNRMPKYVVSATPRKLEWNNSTLVQYDIEETLGSLRKNSPGELAVIGSAVLARWLLERNLVDELRLLVHPVVVGRGQHFFVDGFTQSALRLIESKVFQSGVIGLTFQPGRSK
jgi:dihydrofolate reductase